MAMADGFEPGTWNLDPETWADTNNFFPYLYVDKKIIRIFATLNQRKECEMVYTGVFVCEYFKV